MQIPHVHQNRLVFEASMKLCTGVDPPRGAGKNTPNIFAPLLDAILQFTMSAITATSSGSYGIPWPLKWG